MTLSPVAIHATLSLREADGDFIEDSDPQPFLSLPRAGEELFYDARLWIVVRVRHIFSVEGTPPALDLVCRPATAEEIEIY